MAICSDDFALRSRCFVPSSVVSISACHDCQSAHMSRESLAAESGPAECNRYSLSLWPPSNSSAVAALILRQRGAHRHTRWVTGFSLIDGTRAYCRSTAIRGLVERTHRIQSELHQSGNCRRLRPATARTPPPAKRQRLRFIGGRPLPHGDAA